MYHEVYVNKLNNLVTFQVNIFVNYFMQTLIPYKVISYGIISNEYVKNYYVLLLRMYHYILSKAG